MVQRKYGKYKTNGVAHSFSNPLVLGQRHHSLDVLVRETVGCQLVILLLDVVGLYHCGEHREPIGCVQGAIIIVVIDSRQFLKKCDQKDVMVCCDKSTINSWKTCSKKNIMAKRVCNESWFWKKNLVTSGRWTCDSTQVPLDFKNYWYVVPAVQFSTSTKNSSANITITSMSKLTVELGSLI